MDIINGRDNIIWSRASLTLYKVEDQIQSVDAYSINDMKKRKKTLVVHVFKS